MELQTFIQSLSENLVNKAAVNSVYGEPVVVGEKKVIPIARVACGFGGGAGTAPLQRDNLDESQRRGEGGGGGGGFAAMPVGVVEITPETTRFIRFGATRRLLGAFAFGILFVAVVGRGRLRSQMYEEKAPGTVSTVERRAALVHVGNRAATRTAPVRDPPPPATRPTPFSPAR